VSDDEHLSALAQLEILRQADAPYGRPVNWLKARRLAVFAECCQDREPLAQVMDTKPPVVVVGQMKITPEELSHSGDDRPRRHWQGATQDRGGFDARLLSSFPRTTEMKYNIWCRHRRWGVRVDEFFTRTGRHVLSLPDNVG